MTDEELLQLAVKAARVDRDQRAHDARLEAYAAGSLDAGEVAQGADASAELDAELAGFKPLDANVRARIAERVQASLATSTTAKRAAANVKPLRRPVRRLATAMTVIAFAAGVGLFVRARSHQEMTLPSYEMAAVSGEQEMRGEALADGQSVQHVGRADRLRLLVRPSTAIEGPVEARVFLKRGDDVRAWPSAIEVSRAGAVRVVAATSSLPEGTTGTWDVMVVVGRPGSMPSSTELARRADDVRVVQTRVMIE